MQDGLMIIGAGIMQIPAIQIAQKMGLKVLVTDLNPKALGASMADYFEIASTRDSKKNIEIAQKYVTKLLNLKGVITVGTDFSYTVSCVAEKFSWPGVSPEIAFLATNKLAMRKQLKKCHVPCPDFREVKSVQDIYQFGEEKGFPVVVKPSDNMGARGVRRVDNQESSASAYENAKANSFDHVVIVEECMEGEEVSIDTLVFEGKVYPLTIADRIITFPPYFIEIGHTIPSILPKEQIEDVISVMEQGIKALGIDFSPSKGDIKITKEGAKIGEICSM
ncbi:ATP-grasp domain-containing protein [Candidatus Auribacterota bacterium]